MVAPIPELMATFFAWGVPSPGWVAGTAEVLFTSSCLRSSSTVVLRSSLLTVNSGGVSPIVRPRQSTVNSQLHVTKVTRR